MKYDSEVQRAFSKSPTPFSEEQIEAVMNNQDTYKLVMRIMDLLGDPDPDSSITDTNVVAHWINVRKILWPGTEYEV